MAFNTGLSGLRAAQVDLDVTGNNIANASTVGFKSSRAQFGDLYANGFLSSGSNPVGDGVTVQDIQQQFGQGNISFTDNGLDMAIDGDGFFVLSDGGETRYSRAGQFGIDKEGFVVNNQNMMVQGYQADEDGNISGVRGDLQIETDNLAPRKTTNLETDVNLDSREAVLERRTRTIPVTLDGQDDPASDGIRGESFRFEYADGSTSEIFGPFGTNDTAADVASRISDADGVSASATSDVAIHQEDDVGSTTGTDLKSAIDSGNLTFFINGSKLNTDNVGSLSDLKDEIDKFGDGSYYATVEDEDGDGIDDVINVRRSSGGELNVEWGNDPVDDSIRNSTVTVDNLTITTDRSVVGIAEGDAASPPADLEAAFNEVSPVPVNSFNPLDQRTYNHATSTTIYDSLGNSHELTQFFVKEPSPGNGIGQSEWSVYLQIDGEYVGGTDDQPYTATFNEDGSLASMTATSGVGQVSDLNEIVVTDWVPKDPNGEPNGAEGPNVAPGEDVNTPISEDSGYGSAFVIDLGGSTQYGAAFGVNNQQQNGYTTGRLSGLDVSNEGVIFARYTNGQSQSLGQVALATFQNTDGLSPVGDTAWVETFESGQPVIGKPGTGTLGSIAASSVEESNVDLSEELVNLIIAQRNYQANAKTIETSDAVTQTIINLR